MLSIIKSMLDLWDPYGIYLFPEDEYESYAVQIVDYINKKENIVENELMEFVLSILPPNNAGDIESLSKVEYIRFAKLLLLILNR